MHYSRTSSECFKFLIIADVADESSSSSREYNQLELAIKWNRLDLAEEDLFRGKKFTVEELNKLLWIALEHREVKFVTSIMKKGASLKRFLTEERFSKYLNITDANLDNSPLKKMLNKYVSVSYILYDYTTPLVF